MTQKLTIKVNKSVWVDQEFIIIESLRIPHWVIRGSQCYKCRWEFRRGEMMTVHRTNANPIYLCSNCERERHKHGS